MLVFLLFVLGLAVGSFLNVLIDRIPQGQSPFKGRSYCDKCKKTLKWYDMIPVLSFLILKGKCRYCRTHISFYYPLVEFITGVMFVIVFAYVYGLRSTDYGLSFSILNSPFGLAQGGQFSLRPRSGRAIFNFQLLTVGNRCFYFFSCIILNHKRQRYGFWRCKAGFSFRFIFRFS